MDFHNISLVGRQLHVGHQKESHPARPTPFSSFSKSLPTSSKTPQHDHGSILFLNQLSMMYTTTWLHVWAKIIPSVRCTPSHILWCFLRYHSCCHSPKDETNLAAVELLFHAATYDRELLAAYLAIKCFLYSLKDTPFTVFTDKILTFALKSPLANFDN